MRKKLDGMVRPVAIVACALVVAQKQSSRQK